MMKVYIWFTLVALAAGDGAHPAPPSPPPPSSYGVPVTSGPYGGGSSYASGAAAGQGEGYGAATYIPGQLVTTNNHVSYYAPLYRTYYAPAPSSYHAPAPSPGYGVPSPASSYGVPETSGPYGGGANKPYAAPAPQYGAYRQQVGNAVVSQWLTQTLLHGGGKVTERKVKDGYDGYKTEYVEEWQDQKPNYHYGYDIKGGYGYDKLESSAQEWRDGYKTNGRYSVKQPDGKTRIVEYVVDDWGFKPTITYV